MATEPVDHGEWLNFRAPYDGGTIPVLISREALEDHFGADHRNNDLVRAFLAHDARIVAKALERASEGGVYTDENPLRLTSGDF
ncbi:MAG TPA: DUF1488 family protein [Roseateles sp.]|nr:DUF1488 family protein [Roseateles sp.]